MFAWSDRLKREKKKNTFLFFHFFFFKLEMPMARSANILKNHWHQGKGNEFYDSPPHWNLSQQPSNISKIESETFKDEPRKVYSRLLHHSDPHE